MSDDASRSSLASVRVLSLAHMWVGFALFAVASLLGMFQLSARNHVANASADLYYRSMTLHGVVQAFVLTTFFIAGFGYAITAASLRRPVRQRGLAWLGFVVMLVGSVVAALSIATGKATVLYTFYPPMVAHWTFYVGAALLLVGSLAWTGITIGATLAWKRENPGRPVPLAQFGMTACAMLWAWTLVGVVVEVVFQLLPLSLGLTPTIDVGLARALFSWTLHPIVYFWLIPAYVVLYSILPKAAGGYLFSDEVGRIAFVMLLVISLPIGLHHVFVDPEQAAGWKLMHALGTFMVALPTLLTGFTIAASLETAGRLRGGKGLFGWIGRLPWGEPVALGGILALVALLPGGFGGMVNASYAMDTMVHNTAWITAHFHLILGGTVVTAYFAGAYALWPKLTGRRLRSRGAAATQLWLWFVGLLLLTVPWHWQGLLGMPRRVAYMPYDPALVARWQRFNPPIMLGGMLMILSALLFVVTLLRTQTNPEREADATLALSEPLEPVVHVPKLLNGFAAWNWLLLVLMALAWAYPIGQFFSMTVHKALAWGFR